jgi:hypothetical protein
MKRQTIDQFILPCGFDKVPPIEATLVLLTDFLCFSHDFYGTHFIIWADEGIWSSRVLKLVP